MDYEQPEVCIWSRLAPSVKIEESRVCPSKLPSSTSTHKFASACLKVEWKAALGYRQVRFVFRVGAKPCSTSALQDWRCLSFYNMCIYIYNKIYKITCVCIYIYIYIYITMIFKCATGRCVRKQCHRLIASMPHLTDAGVWAKGALT